MTQFAVLDVETTGLQPSECRILELAIVVMDQGGTVSWQWVGRFDPQGPVGATQIHGITADDVAGAPLFSDSIPFISQVLAGRVVVAHNANFDLAFLRSEYRRAGLEMPWLPSVCTLEASRIYLPDLGRWRLTDCCDACQVAHTDQHSALGDVKATAGILQTYLFRTADHGAWLEWQQAGDAAVAVHWPASATMAPLPLSTRTQGWANRPKPEPIALVEVVKNLNLADALDEGAREGSLAYLELVAAA